MVYKVTATRLFNSRRTVFDQFDGRKWSRSKDKIKATDIEVKDPNAVKDKKDPTAPNNEEPPAAGTAEKELTPEEEAEKELEQEKLNELSKRETGFGPDMRVDYVFNEPPKNDYRISETSAFLACRPSLPSATADFRPLRWPAMSTMIFPAGMAAARI